MIKEMGLVCNYFQMVLIMLDFGKIIKLMVLVDFVLKMALFMKVFIREI